MDYQFRNIERKWQNIWAQNHTYKTDNHSTKPKYYVLDMFPYPSGAGLHVGHPLGYIASDIFARYKRLKGFNVLHPMGYDSFGLPAEQYAIQTGQHPAVTTEANIKRYREQLDDIGFSFDWSREVRTSDPDYYKWTQWIFMQLFNSWYHRDTDRAEPVSDLITHFETHGSANLNAVCDDEVLDFTAEQWQNFTEEQQQQELLKYRLTYLRESTVNWCPALGTVLANDEVKDGFSERGGYPVEQKKMKQWSMRITAYAERLLQGLDTIDWPEPLKEMQRNWIGKSTGALVKFSLTNDTSLNSLTPNPSLKEREAFDKGASYEYETADPGLWEYLKANSRENRKEATEAENILWQHLRNKQTGYKIRRQHVIHTYIADFVCLSKALIIEVDGGYHTGNKDNDKVRTEILEKLGFGVIRFSNEEVLGNVHAVVREIRKVLYFREDLGEAETSTNRSSLSLGEGRGEAHNSNASDEAAISVFTTRVDTIFGVSFLVLAPEHELVEPLTTPQQREEIAAYIAQTKKKTELDRMADTKTVSGAFTGSYATNPLNGELIPIWIADYVLAGYGTGAVMAVPSGDQRDYLFAKQYNLPIIPIIDIQNIENEADPTKQGRYINSDIINGLTYQEATPILIKKLEELGAGKAKINYRMRDAVFGRQRYWGEPVPVYFKNGLPYLIDEKDLPLVLPEIDKYLPTESGEPPLGRAEDWKYNPVSFGEGRGETEKSGEAYDYELSTMPGWAGSSWYWYRYMASPEERKEENFAPKEAIDYWKDVDLYIGGSEHATGHLLYSRFWNKFLKDLGFVLEEEPFKKLINQGMILGETQLLVCYTFEKHENDTPILTIPGKVRIPAELIKVWKSFNPKYDDVLKIANDEYATFGAPNFYRIPIDKVDNNRLYEDEFWDVVDNFLQIGHKVRTEHVVFDTDEQGRKYMSLRPEVEKMSKSKFNVVSPDTTKTSDGREIPGIVDLYGADTFRMYEMFLGPLEQSKPWNTNGIEGVFKFLRKFWKLFHDDEFNFRVSGAEPTKAELKSLHKIIRKVEEDIERFSFNTSVSSFMICINELTDLKCNNRQVLRDLVIVLSPYAPHITEELWALLGNQPGTISYAPYPVFNPEYLVENEFAYPISINGKMKMNLNISLSLEAPEVEQFVLNHADVQRYLDGKNPKKIIYVKGKIVNIVV